MNQSSCPRCGSTKFTPVVGSWLGGPVMLKCPDCAQQSASPTDTRGEAVTKELLDAAWLEFDRIYFANPSATLRLALNGAVRVAVATLSAQLAEVRKQLASERSERMRIERQLAEAQAKISQLEAELELWRKPQ